MDSLMLQIYNNLGRLPNKNQKTCKMIDILQVFCYIVYLIPLSLSALEYFAAFCKCS